METTGHCLLVREVESGQFYYVENNVRRPVADRITSRALSLIVGAPAEMHKDGLHRLTSPGDTYRMLKDSFNSYWLITGGTKYLVAGLAGSLASQCKPGPAQQGELEALPSGKNIVELEDGDGAAGRLVPVSYVEDDPSYSIPTRPFRSYEEFLRAACTNSFLIRAPLVEEDFRIIGAMDWHRQQLAKQYADRPQDILVTILMPAYNRASIIGHAIQAVINQSYQNWELLVIDDGGWDNTREVVEAFADPRIRFYRREENGGHSVARYDVLQHARGYYVASADSDDYWEKDFLLVMVNALRDSEGYRCAYCAQKVWEGVSADTGRGLELMGLRYAPFNRSYLEQQSYINQNTFIHERSLLQECGTYDPALRRLVDWDLYLRLTENNFPLAVPATLSNYVSDGAPNSVTRSEDLGSAFAYIRSKLRAKEPLTDYLSENDLPEVQRLFGSGRPPRKHLYSRPISIVMTGSKSGMQLKACVKVLRRFTPAEYHLNMVDAGSEGLSDEIKALKNDPDISVLEMRKRPGILDLINICAASAPPEDDIVLLDGNTIVTPGWLEAMREVIDDVPSAGIIVPRQVAITGSPEIPASPKDPAYEWDVSFSSVNANVLDPRIFPKKGYIELLHAPFFCVYVRREVLRACPITSLSPEPGWSPERTYCTIVRSFGGFRIVCTPFAKVYHL